MAYLCLNGKVCQLTADYWVVYEFFAVAGCLLAELYQFFQSALCPRRVLYAGAFEVEQSCADIPATIVFADKVFLGNAYIVEYHHVKAVQVSHVYYGPHFDAGGVHIG